MQMLHQARLKPASVQPQAYRLATALSSSATRLAHPLQDQQLERRALSGEKRVKRFTDIGCSALNAMCAVFAPLPNFRRTHALLLCSYVSMGYPCGWWASILFSAHVPRMQGVSVPKLFMQGSSDGFTAPATLQQVVDGCAGDVNEVLIVPDKGHFELEDPRYDTFKCRMVHDFVMQYVMPTVAPELLQPEHPDGLDAAAGELGAQDT